MQGSFLGPLLFICFINDFFKCTDLFSLLFADDTGCLAKGKNLKELILKCNEELQKIANWFSSNLISLNAEKCKFIIFHNKGKRIDTENTPLVFNLNEKNKPESVNKIIKLDRITNSNVNKQDTTYKYLGILLDENLLFDKHIDYICNKLSKALFCLRRAKSSLDSKSMLSIYYSLFHSHLLYCVNILGCSSNTNIKRILLLQKKPLGWLLEQVTMRIQPHYLANLKYYPLTN